METESYTVRNVQEYRYCPRCGAEIEHRAVPIGGGKTNHIAECPNHGELIHG